MIVNYPDICPPPYPAPPLPAPGVLFADSTFGTPLLRVTQGGAQVNDSPHAGMWSAESRFFYVRDASNAFVFYQVIRTGGKLSGVKQISSPQYFYPFPTWDPAKPKTFYVLGLRNVVRYDFTLASGQMVLAAPTVEFDFSRVPNEPIPPSDAGYPYGIFAVAPGVILVAVSSTNGQETFNYLVIYDRKAKTTKVLDLAQRIGWDKKYYRGTHGMLCDRMGKTAYMALNPSEPGAPTFFIAYDRATDSFSPRWESGGTDFRGPGGHFIIGPRWLIGGRYAGGGWSWLDSRTLRVADPVCLFPTKNGLVQWVDQHGSSIGPRGFVSSFYVEQSNVFTWSPPAGTGPWRLVGYHTQWTGHLNDPEEVRYKSLRVPNVGQVPTEPGGWWYDKASDTVYFWPADGDDPNGRVAIFDWFCFTDEIVRFIPDPSGDPTKPWSWERLVHHRCHNDPANAFYTIPKGNLSPDGTLLLFLTNWDGTLLDANSHPMADLVLADIS